MSCFVKVHTCMMKCLSKAKSLKYLYFYFQALANGFFNFDTFDVDEYEHYEVRNFLQLHLPDVLVHLVNIKSQLGVKEIYMNYVKCR